MKIVDAGHTYEVDGFDGGDLQTITFMKREGDGYPFNRGSHGGTNCQEVLRVLIDRTEYLGRQIPCAETEAAIGLMKTALFMFESRAARRHGRQLDLLDLGGVVRSPTCKTCGHVGCAKHETKPESQIN